MINIYFHKLIIRSITSFSASYSFIAKLLLTMIQYAAHQRNDTIKPTMKLPSKVLRPNAKYRRSETIGHGQPNATLQKPRIVTGANSGPWVGKEKTRIAVLSICWFGLLYQLVLTTVDYLSYEMVTSTFIHSPDEITPPSMSFCLYIPGFNQYKEAAKEMECRDDYYAAQQFCVNEFPLKTLMTNFTGNISNYIDFFEFGSYVKISDKNAHFRRKTFHYYFSKYKCLVIPASIGSEMINDHYYKGRVPYGVDLNVVKRQMLQQNLEGNYFLDYKVKMEKVTKSRRWAFVTLFFHDSKNIGHNRDFNFARYYWDKNVEPNVARLNYHQITTEYLKFPFKHNCYDYSSDERFESKGHCQELCTQSELFKKYGEVGRVVTTSTFDDFIPYDRPTMDIEIESKCNLKCNVDCTTIIYNPILDFLWTNNDYMDSFRVQWISSYPQTFITFSPKIGILEYLIFIGGIFGMWIGLDLLSLSSTATEGLITAVKKCLNKT